MDTQEKQTEGMHHMCHKVCCIVRAAIAFAIVGTVVVVIGAILPFWLVDKYQHMGIFLTCNNTFQQCLPIYLVNFSRRIGGVLLWKLLFGLVISGYLLLLVGLGCLCSFLKRECHDPRKTVLAILAAVFLTLAAACISASVIVHMLNSTTPGATITRIGFAWYVTIGGVVCLLACVICLVVVVFKYKKSRIEPSTDNK